MSTFFIFRSPYVYLWRCNSINDLPTFYHKYLFLLKYLFCPHNWTNAITMLIQVFCIYDRLWSIKSNGSNSFMSLSTRILAGCDSLMLVGGGWYNKVFSSCSNSFPKISKCRFDCHNRFFSVWYFPFRFNSN